MSDIAKTDTLKTDKVTDDKSKTKNTSLAEASDKDNAPQKKHTNAPSSPPKTEDELKKMPKEYGGPKGPEPTRYGDWEVDGRCTDF